MGNHPFAQLDHLQQHRNFIPEKNLTEIFDLTATRKIARGRYLYLPEEEAHQVYLLVQGRVKVGTFGDGNREVTKYICRAGNILGEEGVVGAKVRHNFAQALESVTVAVLSVPDFRKALQGNSALSQQLLRIIGGRLVEAEQQLESMVFLNSRSRIIAFLHRLAAQDGQRVGYEMLVRQFITHQEIANLTATSRQTVTTVLNELRNANILTFNRKRMLVRDMDTLAAWCR
jgi:CRP/FNR family transcriptional regulator, cyclic AMP receptor protein